MTRNVYTVVEWTNPETGKTFFYSARNGMKRMGYSTWEQAEKVVRKLNEIESKKSENQLNSNLQNQNS